MAASIEVENRVLSEWANLQDQADRIEATAAAKVSAVSQELKETNAALNDACVRPCQAGCVERVQGETSRI